MNKARINEFAVAAFTLGVMSFIQLAGIEKAVGAIVFGVLALKKLPLPIMSSAEKDWPRRQLS